VQGSKASEGEPKWRFLHYYGSQGFVTARDRRNLLNAVEHHLLAGLIFISTGIITRKIGLSSTTARFSLCEVWGLKISGARFNPSTIALPSRPPANRYALPVGALRDDVNAIAAAK